MDIVRIAHVRRWWLQAHAARDLYALDDEKRIAKLELEAAQQQIDNLQQRVQFLQSQLNLQAQQGPPRSTPSAVQHQQWDALLVRENEDLRKKVEILLQDREQLEADHKSEIDQLEMKMIERQVSETKSDSTSRLRPS
jgi:hypothetical protein